MTDKTNSSPPETFAELLEMLVGQTVHVELSSGGTPKTGVLAEFHKDYVHVGGWSVPIAHIAGVAVVGPVHRDLSNLPAL